MYVYMGFKSVLYKIDMCDTSPAKSYTVYHIYINHMSLIRVRDEVFEPISMKLFQKKAEKFPRKLFPELDKISDFLNQIVNSKDQIKG